MLPALFCECHGYLNHWQHERDGLVALVDQLESDFEKLESVSKPRALAVILSDLLGLRAALRRHVREEVISGGLDDAVCRRPSLSADALQVQHGYEHLDHWISEIVDLIENARFDRAMAPGHRRSIRARLRQLAIRLQEIQADEEKLIAMGLNTA